MFQLQLFDTKSGARRAVPIVDRVLLLGSAVDCDVVLPAADVGGKQCRVEVIDGGLRVVDLGGGHETLLNEQPVGRANLHIGDVLKLGPYQLTVLPAAPSASAAAAPDPAPVAPDPEPKARSAAVPAAAPRSGSRPAAPLQAAPPPAPRGAPANRGESRAPVRSRPKKDSTATVIGAIVVVGMVIGAFVLFGGGGDRPDPELGMRKQKLEQAIQLNGECRFDEALALVSQVVGGSSGEERAAAIEQERRIKTRKQRYAEGKRDLDALRSRVAGDVRGSTLGDLQRFRDANADLAPLLEQVDTLIAQIEERAKQPAIVLPPGYEDLKLPASLTVASCAAEADKLIAEGEFGKANYLLTRAMVNDEAEKQQLAAAFVRVNAGAKVLGDEILRRVKEHLGLGHVLQALGEFDDDNLRPMRGTAIWYDLLEEADKVEDAVDAKIPEHARPAQRRKHARTRPGANGEKKSSRSFPSERGSQGGGRRGEPTGASEPASAKGSAETLQAQARELIAAGDFAGAVRLLDLALDGGGSADGKSEIARDHERASQPLTLAARLAEILAARPLSSVADVVLRDGRRAKLIGSNGKQLALQIGNEQLSFVPAELTTRSLLELSGRVPLTAAESLARAFLALAAQDDKAFFAAIAKASVEPSLHGSIDSALTFQRGLDRVPARGFTHVGERWLTFEERATEELTREVRESLDAALAAKGDPVGARAKIMELAAAAPAIVLEQIKSLRLDLQHDFEAAPEQSRLAKIQLVANELNGARKYALDLIFDEEKYFYPYHPPACPPDKAATYPEVQQEVTRRVAGVIAIWGREDAEPPEPHVTLSAGLHDTLLRLRLVRSLLTDLGAASDEVDAALRPAWSLPDHTKTVQLRNFALDEYERARLDQDDKVWALNSTILPRDDGPTREEIEQVRVTNLYRAMLGRRVLAFNEKLWRAAHGHSEWMSRTGVLSHFEDGDPKRSSPEDRMLLEGYPSGAGENCAVGRSGPLEVLHGWCESSGHHRNLLYDSHTEMGAGQVGSFWTQCFGGGREYKGNLIRD